MSPVAAAFAGLLLCAAAMLPFAWMAFRPGSSRWLAPFCAAAIVVLTFVQTGIFSGSNPPQIRRLISTDTPEARCQQILKVLMDNGILLQPPQRGELAVRGEVWDRFPQNVKDAVLGCAQSPAGTNEKGQVKVIRR